MENKEFKNLMRQYVESKKRGIETDFKKLYVQNHEREIKRCRYNKIAIASLSICLIVALTLSVALPLILCDSEESDFCDEETLPVTIRYYEVKDIEPVLIDSIVELSTEYGINAELPRIEYQNIATQILKSKKNGELIGVRVAISVYDEIFDDIILYLVPENNEIDYLSIYENFTNETIWSEISIKHFIEQNDTNGSYRAQIYFKMSGYKYYIDAEYYDDLNTLELLNILFMEANFSL